MADDNLTICAYCNKAENLKHCVRCKRARYCSRACQKADWPEHKKACAFQVSDIVHEPTRRSELEALRLMPSPLTTSNASSNESAAAAFQVFNTSELRLAIFEMLPARTLLILQRVCRSWYLHVAHEPPLSQRLFIAQGPGRLVFAAFQGQQACSAVQPRNASQLRHAQMTRGPAMSDAGPVYSTDHGMGNARTVSARTLESDNQSIVLNPFFTLIWPQLPTNMTLSPYTAYGKGRCFFNKEASWRTMQITSPPITSLSLSVWITKANGKGTQLRLSTGQATLGVTMGDLASLLETIPKRFERHWMQMDTQAWWSRSADAVVLAVSEAPEIETPDFRGVYVNPSNGIPFPGAFTR